MLYNLPNTGVRDTARKCLLDQFINVLQSSKSLEEKILATLALRGFINDPGKVSLGLELILQMSKVLFLEVTKLISLFEGAVNELGVYAKCMYKTLRKLKRNSVIVNDILKTLMNLPSVNAVSVKCAYS